MTYLYTVEYGEYNPTEEFYECDRCKNKISEAWPHTESRKKPFHLCHDCSFKDGKITEKEYLKYHPFGMLKNLHATIHNGGILLYQGKYHPFKERKKRAFTPRYKAWREKVFKRDNFTCQNCGQKGGELNAHHIKPYAKFKKLRYEINNGVTLCVKCHREKHRAAK